MLVGIDTFEDRLDLTDWSDFRLWNGGTLSMDLEHPQIIGGEPAFAGRNFLGGKFIWGHAEATDAIKTPNPWNLPSITVNFTRIAPIQALNGPRQSQLGERGCLYGQIDGRAICDRIAGTSRAGEFTVDAGTVINIWLAVDPVAEFSVDYWSGWSDAVNSYIYKDRKDGPVLRPFAASILCRYNRLGGRFVREPHIGATLTAAKSRKDMNTTCHDFWADAPDPDADGVRPGPNLDFSLFDAAEMPAIWRFSRSFRDKAGVAQSVNYSLDVVREAVPPDVFAPATSFMLSPARWQPSATNIQNLGFSVSDPIHDEQLKCVQRTPIPEMPDFADEAHPVQAAADHHTHLPARTTSVIGKYLRIPPDAAHPNVEADELQRLSDANVATFVVFERGSAGPVRTAYFQVPNQGTQDATLAFEYCGGTLRLPPYSIVYFAVDYDAGDPSTNGVEIAEGRAGGPDAERLVGQYFDQIAAQRDVYTSAHPDRPFEIGVYGPGKVLEWCYGKGVVTGFWQSLSSGATGNSYGTRPWGHASRWQYQGIGDGHVLPAPWACIPGIDPDVDWGDGGQWNLNDRSARTLTELEDREGGLIRDSILRAHLRQTLRGFEP